MLEPILRRVRFECKPSSNKKDEFNSATFLPLTNERAGNGGGPVGSNAVRAEFGPLLSLPKEAPRAATSAERPRWSRSKTSKEGFEAVRQFEAKSKPTRHGLQTNLHIFEATCSCSGRAAGGSGTTRETSAVFEADPRRVRNEFEAESRRVRKRLDGFRAACKVEAASRQVRRETGAGFGRA